MNASSSTPAVGISETKTPRAAVALVRGGLLARLEWTVVGTLAIFIVLGFGLRVSRLGAIGFAEDEMNKLDAVRAYRRGDITANAEHPMIMKALMFASLEAASAWHKRGGRPISEETALRLPNVIVGTLTVIPLFLLTAAFFDRWTGLLAAGFWAFGINAITMNRVGKEDTLLVFFMLFAFYFYLRAKQTSPRNVAVRRKNYILSSISFGLMLASKYFPHYFGLNALYHHWFHVRNAGPGEPGGKTPLIFYLLLPVAFIIANPALLIPEVWEYLNAYMGERLLVHTGYLFGDRLYKNTMSATPFWGTPVYFYLLFMAIKIPLLVVAAFISGLIVSIKRRGHPGHAFLLFMFLFWIVPYSLVGAKWMRYTLSLMPSVYMLAAVGAVAGIGFLSSFVKGSERDPQAGSSRGVQVQAPLMVSALLVLILLVLPAWTAYANRPHYALYTNALGAGRAGYYFPHDEFYDDGLREAIKFVCDNAPRRAAIAHETPAVARYYLERFARLDLASHAMSTPEFDPQKLSAPAFMIVQNGRIYFENRDKISFIRANFKRVYEVRINEITAAEVFSNQ
ncbi:MAG: ArnT family glycosyltransferase [Pyrinomonadaceae bacterium]